MDLQAAQLSGGLYAAITGSRSSSSSRLVHASLRSDTGCTSVADDDITDKESQGLLARRDAVGLGAGVLLGLAAYSRSETDFLAGCAVSTLLLGILSTPSVTNGEALFVHYKAHVNGTAAFVHALLAWPLLFTFMLGVASISRWAWALAALYAGTFIFAEPSLLGAAAAAAAGVCHVAARPSARCASAAPCAESALMRAGSLHVGLWAAVMLAHLLAGGLPRLRRVARLIRDHAVVVVLMGPLFAVLELAVLLGFRKNFARRVRYRVAKLQRDMEDAGDL